MYHNVAYHVLPLWSTVANRKIAQPEIIGPTPGQCRAVRPQREVRCCVSRADGSEGTARPTRFDQVSARRQRARQRGVEAALSA